MNSLMEAFFEFIKFIPKFSPVCSSELRLACMAVSGHDSFMLLNSKENDNRKYRYRTSEHYLTHRMLSAKDRSLRRMLGYQRDEIQVYERDSVSENCFFVRLVFRMFQKRLRITRKLEVEFVARGMWSVLLTCSSR